MSSTANNNNVIQSPFNKVRKDKFLMVLNYPPALKQIIDNFNRANGNIIPQSLEFSVYGSIVPPIKIPPVILKYSGQSLKVTGYTREPYDELKVKFTIDNRFNNYWVMYKWLNILNDDKLSIYDSQNLSGLTPFNSSELEKQYMTNISIFGLDEYNKRTIEFKYTKAFPTSLGGIDYSYQEEGEIESEIGIAYSQYLPVLNEQVENL